MKTETTETSKSLWLEREKKIAKARALIPYISAHYCPTTKIFNKPKSRELSRKEKKGASNVWALVLISERLNQHKIWIIKK